MSRPYEDRSLDAIRERWAKLADVDIRSRKDYALLGEQAFGDIGALLALIDGRGNDGPGTEQP